jgi:DNA-binding MarR family transcriptional regulator
MDFGNEKKRGDDVEDATNVMDTPVSPVVAGRAQSGERIKQVLSFLQREQGGGSELIFTSEYAAQVKAEIGITNGHLYRTLESLEGKGLITRKHLEHRKGILITLTGKSAKVKPGKAEFRKDRFLTVQSVGNDIRARVIEDIAALEAQLLAKKQFLAELDSYMKREVRS